MSDTLTQSELSTAGADGVTGVAIDLIGVTKRYPGQRRAAVEPLDLHIPPGRS
ncbi:hypothetical protein GCM10027613_17920 [Microlunatus endophyticus]